MGFLEITACSCSLEKLIGFIVEINQIRKFQFIVYLKKEKDRLQRMIELGDDDIFTYKENVNRQIYSLLPRGEAIYKDWIKNKYQFIRLEQENLGITSMVWLDDSKIKHIPMIDFKCSYSAENLQKVGKTLLALGQRSGFILESGQSYHYYGIELLNVRSWIDFMEQCKNYEIIGKIWPDFQLDDGYATLRIATSSAKPYLPKVIAKFGNFKF